MDQYRRVLHHLRPCAGIEHTKDADWFKNHHKGQCRHPGCERALCEACAAKVVRSQPQGLVSDLWCWEHA